MPRRKVSELAEQIWTLLRDFVDEESIEETAEEMIEIFESFEFNVSGAKTLCADANIESEDDDLAPDEDEDPPGASDDED